MIAFPAKTTHKITPTVIIRIPSGMCACVSEIYKAESTKKNRRHGDSMLGCKWPKYGCVFLL